VNLPRYYYFDNNATTRVAPEVIEAMLPFLIEHWANASSGYQMAHRVAKEIEEARAKAAALVNADPREIVFTSGGTESINTALHSACALQPAKRHVVTTAVEHSATLRYVEDLAKLGYDITLLPVGREGALDLNFLERSIRPETAIVSIMWANNETGVLFPVDQIAAVCRSKGVPFHTDAVQAAGKVALDVQAVEVDLLSLSAHKFYAPKGIGMLYIRRASKFQPYILGGQQERGRRGGTENVANIIAFGRAAELARANLVREQGEVRALRDLFEARVLATIPGTSRNGAAEPRLPNTSNIVFDSTEAEAILLKLDQAGICASSGSACATGSLEPSHVLKAMGLPAAQARASLRFSFGQYNRLEEVDYLVRHLEQAVAKLGLQDKQPERQGIPPATSRIEPRNP
jgi:cysteine desulfurase